MKIKMAYPALRASMGIWSPYYIVRMSLGEIVNEVQIMDSMKRDPILDDIFQRPFKVKRVKDSVAPFLFKPDRFFPAIVVAALGGNAKFRPVRMKDVPDQDFWIEQGLDEAFGILTFEGDQKYYALDGQHRLGAIQHVVNDAKNPPSPELLKEQVSVLVICRKEDDVEFLKSYRRLFTSLNRYAVKTDDDVNIAMDEDDAFAIVTRRLIMKHDFFKTKKSAAGEIEKRVQTIGKNIAKPAVSPCFTSLRTLYGMNIELLRSEMRNNSDEWEWNSKKELDAFKSKRPADKVISDLYNEVALYWSVLAEVLPELAAPPSEYRDHSAPGKDHVLFWPLGQEAMMPVVRRLLDKRLGSSKPTPEKIKDALAPLAKVDWRLHAAPWRNILLVKEKNEDDEKQPWIMRVGDRQPAQDISQRFAQWLLGVDRLNQEAVDDLKARWKALLLPAKTKEEAEKMWAEIEKQKKRCSG